MNEVSFQPAHDAKSIIVVLQIMTLVTKKIIIKQT